jgi:hypothetical protein
MRSTEEKAKQQDTLHSRKANTSTKSNREVYKRLQYVQKYYQYVLRHVYPSLTSWNESHLLGDLEMDSSRGQAQRCRERPWSENGVPGRYGPPLSQPLESHRQQQHQTSLCFVQTLSSTSSIVYSTIPCSERPRAGCIRSDPLAYVRAIPDPRSLIAATHASLHLWAE